MACSWLWSGPHGVLKKFKTVAKIENQDIAHQKSVFGASVENWEDAAEKRDGAA